MNYNIERVTTKDQLDFLYKNSALTVEGMPEEQIDKFVKWAEDNQSGEIKIVYLTKGKLMNKIYYLTGDNAYDDDLTIVSVIPENITLIIMSRFNVEARWFDYIVDNNLRREKIKNKLN